MDTTNEIGVAERGTGKAKIPGHIVITKTDKPNALWYVVHTSSGHEARVAETLRQRVHTLGLEKKIFPGYLLVRMILDDNVWLAVRTTPGVTGFVGAGSTPTPLSGNEVENIEKFISQPAPRYKTKMSVGEAVKITDGPFTDFLGTIHEIDQEKGKVKVLVSIFGRETPVELDFLQIAKV